MLPTPSEVVYFLEVSSTLNISRAAERLGITQPTLSLSIQRLELAIGTPLLLRGKTGVRLTKAGSRFAIQAKALLEQWDKMRADALSEETEIKGNISVGCHASVALYSVGGFAATLMNEHPDLEISFHHDLSRKITERVISFELDCGVVVNPVAHPDLRIVTLATDEVSFWKGASLAGTKDVLIFDPELAQSQTLLGKMKKHADGASFRRAIHSSNLEVVAKLASIGAGVAILPSRVALREPAYKLKPLSVKGPVFEDKICLIYRPDASRSLAFKTVVRAIESSFKAAP